MARKTRTFHGMKFALLLAPILLSATLATAEPTFKKNVEPIFKAKCTKCHGFIAQKGLKLTSLKNLMKGGDSGAVIVPGSPEASILYQQFSLPTTDPKRMPPVSANSELTAGEKETIRAWIAAGAK